MTIRYSSTDLSEWTGRIDDTANKDNFRWHQIVKALDLTASNISRLNGFCILGFKCDQGVENNKGRKGAYHAPDFIRKAMASFPWHWSGINLYDAGNVVCDDGNLKSAQKELTEKVTKILDLGLFPIILGGGHETALGSVFGVEAHFNKIPAIINFDAHFDMRSYKLGCENGASSGTMFRQIGDRCIHLDEPFNYLCLGIQKSGNTANLFEIADKYAVEYVSADEIISHDNHYLVDQFIDNNEMIHLTICSDVFQSSIAPGVSAPQPFGINIDSFYKIFKTILSHGEVVSFDISEVLPELDMDGRTSRLAANIIFKLIDILVGEA